MLMKILLSFAFACSSLVAQPVLTLSLQDSSFFTAEINNQVFNEPLAIMNFYDLPAGNHQLKVYKILKTGNSIVKQPVYEGKILIDKNSSTIAYIDGFNQLKITGKTAIIESSKTSSSSNQTEFPNPKNIPTNTQQTTDAQGMNNAQFKSLLGNLASIDVENERLKTAKGLISISTLKSSQIAEIMLQFEMESNRIYIADYSNKYVSDPQNYDIVYNAIRSPRSIRRLNRRLSN